MNRYDFLRAAARVLVPALAASALVACGGGGDEESTTDAALAHPAVDAWPSDDAVPGEPAPPSAESAAASEAADPATASTAAGAPALDPAAALPADDAGPRMGITADPPLPAIAPADIVYALKPADLGTYRYSTLACMGGNKYWWDWGGSKGRYLSTTIFPLRDTSGTLRAGIVPDPDDESALAFESSVKPTDADTSGAGNKRCEIALSWTEYRYPGRIPTHSAMLPRNRDFWWAIKFRLGDWRATQDRQVIFQWLSPFGGSVSPMMSVYAWGSMLRMELHHDFSAKPSEATRTKLVPWTLEGWQPNRWYTAVFRARVDAAKPSNGKLALWLDGNLVLDYRGPVGHTAPAGGDYAKFGLYHWTSGNPWDMKVVKRSAWYKGPALVLDQPGYTPAAIAAKLE